MKTNIKTIEGVWDTGYTIDKHSIKSIPIGENEYGHMQFETTRSEIGEALYQLKYRNDKSKAKLIAEEIFTLFEQELKTINTIIPMPSSKLRTYQPVNEIAKELSALTNIPINTGVLTKQKGLQSKNIESISEKEKKISESMSINKTTGTTQVNVLLLDDIYDSGTSLSSAAQKLKTDTNIKSIFALAVTRKNEL